MASALVVQKEDMRLRKHLFNWMREVSAPKGKSESAETEFWVEEVKRAHEFYARG